MSEKQREIKWMAPFGPIIMETMITEQVHEILVNRADQLRGGKPKPKPPPPLPADCTAPATASGAPPNPTFAAPVGMPVLTIGCTTFAATFGVLVNENN